jgi:hypothetical protein
MLLTAVKEVARNGYTVACYCTGCLVGYARDCSGTLYSQNLLKLLTYKIGYGLCCVVIFYVVYSDPLFH